ncbi:hypothetical protein RvY_06611 [Ramazzottius varieornatus]|uniref:Citrate transport protein n=1 Tax=Ramazzottius varieornatus TaxID=947166 RepID=A0A1D1V4N4_RAMVA|nr:hypothetical protein RvY_06611 [Ramazzottius varieornatus]
MTGAVEMSVNFPTDYVKTQLQLDERSVKRRYTGIADVVRQTIRNDGVRGLYRGLNVAIWNPKVAVRFASFEQLRKLVGDSEGKLSRPALLFCGMMAGLCEAVLAVTPVESIKVKFIDDMNSPERRYRGLFHGIRTIVHEHGFRGIYQGVTPTIMKSMSSQGTRFFIVESLKDWRKQRNPGKSIPKPLTAVFGAIGGAVSVLINAPADAVKTRMQGLEAGKYRNTIHCVQQMWKHEGTLVFYNGVIPRFVRVPIETAIVFSVYDVIRENLDAVW